MILFSQNKVETKLAHNEFSEWEKVKYFLVPPIVTALMGGPIFLVRPRYGVSSPWQNSVSILLGGVILVWIIYCSVKRIFKTNERTDGKDFITRFTILSVPVFMRYFLIFTPLCLVGIIVFAALTRNAQELRVYFSIVVNVVVLIITALYYASVNKSFKRFGERIGAREDREQGQPLNNEKGSGKASGTGVHYKASGSDSKY